MVGVTMPVIPWAPGVWVTGEIEAWLGRMTWAPALLNAVKASRAARTSEHGGGCGRMGPFFHSKGAAVRKPRHKEQPHKV
jgi:hypothetical protein